MLSNSKANWPQNSTQALTRILFYEGFQSSDLNLRSQFADNGACRPSGLQLYTSEGIYKVCTSICCDPTKDCIFKLLAMGLIFLDSCNLSIFPRFTDKCNLPGMKFTDINIRVHTVPTPHSGCSLQWTCICRWANPRISRLAKAVRRQGSLVYKYEIWLFKACVSGPWVSISTCSLHLNLQK